MTRRLRDEPRIDGDALSGLIELCRRVEPTRTDARAEARVWVRLGRRQAAPARWLPALAVGGVILFLTTSVLAMWRPRIVEAVRGWLGAERSTAPAVVRHAVPVVEDRGPSASPPVVEPSPAIGATAPDVASPPPKPKTVRVAPSPAPLVVEDRAPPSPPETEPEVAPEAKPRAKTEAEMEAELVYQASLSLRNDHRPERALQLLDAYRMKHPHGVLEEEALALSIEAASAAGESRTHALAADYLDRFPSGRFRALAETFLKEDRGAAH
jgi:hypothetical protein